MTWREQAAVHIQAVAVEWLAEHGLTTQDLPRLDEAQQRDLLRAISAAFPWHPRENHPYDAWLAATRDFRKQMPAASRPKPKQKKQAKREVVIVPEQGRLL